MVNLVAAVPVFVGILQSGLRARLHFGKDGDRLIILLGGGTKKRQQKDIRDAITRWQDYKMRRQE